ncbi:MAG: hypothetical protein ACI8PZ_006144 [Myxococcota bacterium]|jgi:hypothetical protein
MRTLIVMLALVTAVPVLMVPTVCEAADTFEPPDDFLSRSVQMEVEAFQALATAMDKIVKANPTITWSENARKARSDAQVIYKEAQAIHKTGDTEGAYLKLQTAWTVHKPATTEVLDKGPEDQLGQVAVKFLAMLDLRMGQVDAMVAKGPPAAKPLIDKAKTKKTEAHALEAKGQHRDAILKAQDALTAWDQAMQLCWAKAKQ